MFAPHTTFITTCWSQESSYATIQLIGGPNYPHGWGGVCAQTYTPESKSVVQWAQMEL